MTSSVRVLVVVDVFIVVAMMNANYEGSSGVVVGDVGDDE